MASFKQGSSGKFQDYMIQLIKKIHDVEEMLLSGDDRHLEELKEFSDMIEQYVNEAQGHKFEPAQYRNVQGQSGQQGQPSNYRSPYTDFPEYPQDPRRGQDIKGHIGYIPYRYPYVYPLFNERGGNDGSRRSEGYSPDYYDRNRR